ncbi:hypothetical protein O0544_01660 [Edwardsiella anguillarum]|nr:hypothetical protein [Edwardsiella anguillarum]
MPSPPCSLSPSGGAGAGRRAIPTPAYPSPCRGASAFRPGGRSPIRRRAPDGERYYRHSPQKLDRAIACFNRQPLAFVATLGDLVDRHWRDYPALLARYRALRHPHLIVSGNHDAVALAAHLAAAQPPSRCPSTITP